MTSSRKYDEAGGMKPGQDLVAAGYAGLAGTRILVKAKRDLLESRFSGGYLRELTGDSQVRAHLWSREEWISLGAAEWEPGGEGGILSALWHLTGAHRLGAEFSQRRIPVRQGTIEVCEVLGLNPYRLYSKGCWLLASDNGGRLAEALEKRGMAAAVIGRITSGIARVMTDGSEISYLNRPQPDELERVIPEWKSGIVPEEA